MNYTHTNTVGGQCPSLFRRFAGLLVTLLSVAAMAATASAQTATITGRVINQGTGEYLKYAQVQVVGTDKSAVTEEGGVYAITGVPAGEIKLSASYTGLDSQEVTVTVPAEGTITQDFSMATADYGDTIKLGTFSVSGAREGNAKAIVEQRVALNLKTVVAADAFGDVSEGNVGEFLKLLPGVSVDYVDNDARSTRIRGLPPKYNTTTMDGHPFANAASSSISTGRQLELEQVSMAAMDTIESTKTPTPDMMTPNLAGNVNAVSKSAFNQKGRSIKYQASVNFNQWNINLKESKGWDNTDHYKALPGGKIEWVDTFFDGKLGMVASLNHSGAFAEQRIIIGTVGWDGDANNNATEMPKVSQWNFQHGLKPTWRDSMLLNFDYKVSDDLKLSLRTNYGYYRSEFYNRNWLVNAGGNAANTFTPTASTTDDPTFGTNNMTQSDLDGATQTQVYARYVAQPVYTNTVSTTGTSPWTVRTNANVGSNQYARVLGSNQRKSGGTFIINPAVSWKKDDLKIDAGASYSQAKNAYTSGQDGYFSLVQADMRGVSWEYYRPSDDKVIINQLNTVATLPTSGSGTTASLQSNTGSFFDLGNYQTGGQVNNERRNSKDQMWTGNFDAEYNLSGWSIPTTFKVGAAHSLEVRDIHNFQARWTMSLTTGATSTTRVNLQDFNEAFRGGVGDVSDITGRRGKTPAPDKWTLFNLFQASGNTDPLSLAANGPFQAQAGTNLRALLQNDVDLREKISAAYVMATVKPMKNLSIIGGLRFEKTSTTGRSFDDKGSNATLLALGYTTTQVFNTTGAGGMTTTAKTAAGVTLSTQRVLRGSNLGNTAINTDEAIDYIYYRYGSRISRTNEYNNVLPSLQGRYQITKNFIARAAFYGSLLRPDFQSVVGGVTASESSDATYYNFSINNTKLKPETARNYDLSLEYYFEPVGLVSATIFYKDIKDIQINQPGVTTASADPDIVAQIRDAGYSDADINNSNSRTSSTINGPKTSIKGFELSYSQELSFLPSIWKGFGVTANYSHYMPEEERLWALVPGAGDGMPLNSANLIIRYKQGKFAASVSTTWTDVRISGLGGMNIDANGNFTPTGTSNVNVTAYQSARTVVSTNVEYKFHRNATVYLGVNNLLNSPKFNYSEREVYTTRYGLYGASINVGVKGSF